MHISVTMPVRNSGWILGLTARAVLRWADSLVILNHASSDNTAEIIAEVAAEHPGRVVSLYDPDPTWQEMQHRQRCLEAARTLGADVICIVDDDELLSGNMLPYSGDFEKNRHTGGHEIEIRSLIHRMQPSQILQLPWLCCWRSTTQYRAGDSSVWSRNMVSMAFRDAPDLHWANAADGYCFHHRQPRPDRLAGYWPLQWNPVQGGLLHFQHASWRRLLAKQYLYELVETLRWPGRKPPHEIAAMYRGTVDETGLRTLPIPSEWVAPYADIWHHLHVEDVPWQEPQIRRLIAQHGREKFSGLDPFGLEI